MKDRPVCVARGQSVFRSTANSAIREYFLRRSSNVQHRQSSVIVRVRGPLVIWSRSQASGLRTDGAIADGSSGSLAFRRALSVFPILSRRSVRRHNSISALAFIAVRTDEVASLLP